MSEPDHVPRGLVIGGAALMVASLLLAALGRESLAHTQQAEAAAPALVTRMLSFADADNGDVVATDADGLVVARFNAAEHGFARGVLRGLFRARKLDRLPREAPFELSISAKERLTLKDPLTGRSIDLQAFGDDNAATFAPLLRETRLGQRSP